MERQRRGDVERDRKHHECDDLETKPRRIDDHEHGRADDDQNGPGAAPARCTFRKGPGEPRPLGLRRFCDEPSDHRRPPERRGGRAERDE